MKSLENAADSIFEEMICDGNAVKSEGNAAMICDMNAWSRVDKNYFGGNSLCFGSLGFMKSHGSAWETKMSCGVRRLWVIKARRGDGDEPSWLFAFRAGDAGTAVGAETAFVFSSAHLVSEMIFERSLR